MARSPHALVDLGVTRSSEFRDDCCYLAVAKFACCAANKSGKQISAKLPRRAGFRQ